jgi:hypothetical protein
MKTTRVYACFFGDVTIPNTGEEEDWLVIDVKVDDVVARVDLISMVRQR